MKNKIIAAGVVVALCAVALIGVGYAYTATVTNSNSAVSEYVVLNINDRDGFAESLFSTDKIEFSTATTTDGTKWTAISQTVDSNDTQYLRITASNVSGDIELDLTVSNWKDNGAEAVLLGNGAVITFIDTANDQNKVVYTHVYTAEEPAQDSWSKTGLFTIGKTYKATITTVAIVDSDNINSEPAVSFGMTLTYQSS